MMPLRHGRSNRRLRNRKPLFESLESRALLAAVPPPSGIVSWWTGDSTAYDLIGQNDAPPHCTEMRTLLRATSETASTSMATTTSLSPQQTDYRSAKLTARSSFGLASTGWLVSFHSLPTGLLISSL
jgi:hypothetical protein